MRHERGESTRWIWKMEIAKWSIWGDKKPLECCAKWKSEGVESSIFSFSFSLSFATKQEIRNNTKEKGQNDHAMAAYRIVEGLRMLSPKDTHPRGKFHSMSIKFQGENTRNYRISRRSIGSDRIKGSSAPGRCLKISTSLLVALFHVARRHKREIRVNALD